MKSPALGHILGYTALTVMLTAGAAQSLAGSNTVFGDDIVDGTITTPDLKNGALSGSKILDNSVTGADINESTLALPPGPQGPPGPEGPSGPQGPAGELVKIYVWTEDVVNVPTTMRVDSDDVVPAGVRLEATSIEVTALDGGLPNQMAVGASVGGQTLASFNKAGDQIQRVYSPERTTTAATKLRFDIAMSSPAYRLIIRLRFAWKDPEQTFN